MGLSKSKFQVHVNEMNQEAVAAVVSGGSASKPEATHWEIFKVDRTAGDRRIHQRLL
jgi:hypothetical protein